MLIFGEAYIRWASIGDSTVFCITVNNQVYNGDIDLIYPYRKSPFGQCKISFPQAFVQHRWANLEKNVTCNALTISRDFGFVK